jgi:hypothetical protein
MSVTNINYQIIICFSYFLSPILYNKIYYKSMIFRNVKFILLNDKIKHNYKKRSVQNKIYLFYNIRIWHIGTLIQHH